MTILKCDRCKKEVNKFVVSGSAYFPEGYQEVCNDCWTVVQEAVDKAEAAAEKAKEAAFNKEFLKLARLV